MSFNLRQAGENAHSRLEDVRNPRWFQRSRLERYILQGLQTLAIETSLILDFMVLDDFPNAANRGFRWEEDFRFSFRRVTSLAGGTIPPRLIKNEVFVDFGASSYAFAWEGGYALQGSGPANFAFGWEAQYIASPFAMERRPVLDLPDQVYMVDRVTHDSIPLMSVDPQTLSSNPTFQITVGMPRAYSLLMDHIRQLRIYPTPQYTSQYIPDSYFGLVRGTVDSTPNFAMQMHLDEWGMVFGGVLDTPPSIFRDFSPGLIAIASALSSWQGDFAAYTTYGRGGVLRNMSGYDSSWYYRGFPRRISPEDHTTKLEFIRKPATSQSAPGTDFVVPDLYVRYAIWYAMGRALMDDGPAQNLKLGAHYMARFTAGEARVKDRIVKAQRLAMLLMSDQGNVLHAPAPYRNPDMAGPMMDPSVYPEPFIRRWRR